MTNWTFNVVAIKADIIGIETINQSQTHQFQFGELVNFATGAIGIVLRANTHQANVALVVGDAKAIQIGTKCQPSGQAFTINIHQSYFDNVIDVSGNSLVAKPIKDQILATTRVIKPAIPMYNRIRLSEPLLSGTIAIDGILPIGLGQKQLIVGDATTGKSALAIKMLLAQAKTNVKNIYVAIGKKREEIVELTKVLADHDVAKKTIIIAAASDDHAANKYLAPYVGAAISEYWQSQGEHVLVIFDDLSNHADAYRQLALLNDQAPGREAYPGDIFYTHSRLLERCGRFSAQAGGGSITMIPIVQTQAGDISAYIPTNIISITDGQIYTSKEIFNEGRRPAIEIGISVSRLGSQVQSPAMKQATSGLKNLVANYETMQKRESFSNEQLNATLIDIKTKGTIFQAIVDQGEFDVIQPEVSALLFFLLNQNHLNAFGFGQDFLTIKNQINLIKTILNQLLTTSILGKKLAKLIATKALDDQLINRYLEVLVLPLIKYYLLKHHPWLANDAKFQASFATIRDDRSALVAYEVQNLAKGIVYGTNS